ncbi:hypothetical protein PENSPDRAFT_324621 [Peniophora sp. CONT]|nr:hypothetical protein PENSPDRAFT_324621 [Peniophora sp. CONT]
MSMQRGMRALCSLGDAFYLLSRAVDLLAQHGPELHVYDAPLSDPMKQFEITLMLTIRLYCHNVGKWSRGNHPEHTPQDVEDMKVAARVDWWPSLRALQTVKYRAMRTPQRKYYDRVLSAWTELGRVLGLDAEKERKRHEHEAAQRCTWFACPDHRSTPSMGTLKACKGCGEVRYCGRECQRRDWNKGGHKEKCRRLT